MHNIELPMLVIVYFFTLTTILSLPQSITNACIYLLISLYPPFLYSCSMHLPMHTIDITTSGLDQNEQLQNLSSLKYDNNTLGCLRYYTLTHLYGSNLQQFWMAFVKMIKERTVKSLTLLEAIHNATFVKHMNRSVLHVHQSQKTVYNVLQPLVSLTAGKILISWRRIGSHRVKRNMTSKLFLSQN